MSRSCRAAPRKSGWHGVASLSTIGSRLPARIPPRLPPREFNAHPFHWQRRRVVFIRRLLARRREHSFAHRCSHAEHRRHCQGTPVGNASIRASDPTVKHIHNERINTETQQRQLDPIAIAAMNRDHLAATGPELSLERRLSSFEPAYRMHSAMLAERPVERDGGDAAALRPRRSVYGELWSRKEPELCLAKTIQNRSSNRPHRNWELEAARGVFLDGLVPLVSDRGITSTGRI